MVSDLISALILAVVQGITEWFPISSSGHLVLIEKLLGFSGGLVFEVALHFGTLMAVFVYFGRDITEIVRDLFSFKFKTEHGRMGLFLILASIPAGIAGYLIKDFFDAISSLGITALGFAITGILLLITSFSGVRKGNMNSVKVLGIGIAQAVSIIPGISRSGATISSGVLLGLSEKNAMKFAFLMAIPVIFGANIIAIGTKTLPPTLIWATLVSFIVGLLSIHLVFKYVLTSRKNFKWFGFYCLILAFVLLIYLMI
ncbi:MAG: undecaprenyl-diphosphate phosphatase [Candidatus Pacearchaeota archaeon]|nr:undecaprenyl-diphosphate phosphatase [Candidatus Pacearchaeota archaeon]